MQAQSTVPTTRLTSSSTGSPIGGYGEDGDSPRNTEHANEGAVSVQRATAYIRKSPEDQSLSPDAQRQTISQFAAENDLELVGEYGGEDDALPSDSASKRAVRLQRAVAYVRESTEEQGQGFSPDAQRQAISKFAAENELELIDEYCDFHSGWRKSEARPEFQRLMADAADGRFDVVLIFHTSRFARSQVEARKYKQLLRERLGVRVVSVTQPMGEDPSDPSSFLAESIHEMFDEYYSVSLSFCGARVGATRGCRASARRSARSTAACAAGSRLMVGWAA